MDFIWDDAKNKANIRKHGLSFETAVRIFADPLLYVDYDELHSADENRNRYIGTIEGRHVTTIFATDRNESIRIISARKSTQREVRLYEDNAKTIQGY